MTDELIKDLDLMYSKIKRQKYKFIGINPLEVLINRFDTKEGVIETVRDIDQIIRSKLAERGHTESLTEIGMAYELYSISKSAKERAQDYRSSDDLSKVLNLLSRTTKRMYLTYLSRVK